MPLKEDTSTIKELEFPVQSALALKSSLPPYEEFFPRTNEDVAMSLPHTQSPTSSLPVTRLTMSPRW